MLANSRVFVDFFWLRWFFIEGFAFVDDVYF